MLCQNCKQTMPDNSSFCENCGAKVADSVIKETTNKISGLQTAALVMGILGFFIPLTNVLAIIFGTITLKEKPNGKALAGLILGIISLLITLIIILILSISLNSAKNKAGEYSIISDTSQIKTDAEIFL